MLRLTTQCTSNCIPVPRHDLSGTAIGLPIRPGVVPGGSMGQQSYGSPMDVVSGSCEYVNMLARI